MGQFGRTCSVPDGGNFTMEVAVTDIKQVQKLRPVVIDPLQLAASMDNGFDRRTVSLWRKKSYRWIGASGESVLHLPYSSTSTTFQSNQSRFIHPPIRADKNVFLLVCGRYCLASPDSISRYRAALSVSGWKRCK